jgi:hypothetical protein
MEDGEHRRIAVAVVVVVVARRPLSVVRRPS